MFCISLILVALALLGCAGRVTAQQAQTGNIAHWVDENGVSHFGNPQFAPAQHTRLRVGPTNSMDRPRYRGAEKSSRFKVTYLERGLIRDKKRSVRRRR
jgi:hypothetical protein